MFPISRTDLINHFHLKGFNSKWAEVDGIRGIATEPKWIYANGIASTVCRRKLWEWYPVKPHRPNLFCDRVEELVEQGYLAFRFDLHSLHRELNVLADEGFLEKSEIKRENGVIGVYYRRTDKEWTEFCELVCFHRVCELADREKGHG